MINAEVKNGKLTITADVSQRPQPSRTGKTLVGATSNGFIVVNSDDDKEYQLNFNLIIRR